MNFGTPQIIYLSLLFFCLVISAARNGEPRDGKHNFALSFLSAIATCFILYCGGFFG